MGLTESFTDQCHHGSFIWEFLSSQLRVDEFTV